MQGEESLLGIEIWTLCYNFTKHVFQTVIFGHFERENYGGPRRGYTFLFSPAPAALCLSLVDTSYK